MSQLALPGTTGCPDDAVPLAGLPAVAANVTEIPMRCIALSWPCCVPTWPCHRRLPAARQPCWFACSSSWPAPPRFALLPATEEASPESPSPPLPPRSCAINQLLRLNFIESGVGSAHGLGVRRACPGVEKGGPGKPALFTFQSGRGARIRLPRLALDHSDSRSSIAASSGLLIQDEVVLRGSCMGLGYARGHGSPRQTSPILPFIDLIANWPPHYTELLRRPVRTSLREAVLAASK